MPNKTCSLSVLLKYGANPDLISCEFDMAYSKYHLCCRNHVMKWEYDNLSQNFDPLSHSSNLEIWPSEGSIEHWKVTVSRQ